MNGPIDKKRILIFLAFAFGIAWVGGLVIYLTGGLADSPEITPGSGFTVALLILSLVYMWAPTWAHLLTRLITREGWQDLYLRPRRRGWPYWVAAWVLPTVMTILGAAVFFVLLPKYYDPSLGMLREIYTSAGQPVPDSLWSVMIIQTISALAIAPLINGLFTFGEEFGWRAYLQPKLMPLGGRKTMLIMGVIWGVWHWPVIAMGHNYGLDYPGAPWLGMLLWVWATIGLGTFLGWVTLRSGCVWPAVIGHGAINGISALAIMCVQGTPSPLLGPAPIGLLGSAAWAVLTIVLFVKPGALKPSQS